MQATEHTELKLKLVQALVKVSKVSHNEMTAVLSLLLPHRNVSKINLMIQFIYSGIPVDAVSDRSAYHNQPTNYTLFALSENKPITNYST